MIEARKRFRARGAEGIRIGVVHVGIKTSGGGVFVIQGAPECENFAVGENGRVHLDAWLRHAWTIHPFRGGCREIDDFCGCGRRIAAAEDHDPRLVTVGRGKWQEDRGAVSAHTAEVRGCHVQGPSVGGRIENAGGGGRAGVKDVAVWQQMHAWIQGGSPRGRKRRAPSRAYRVNLNRRIRAASILETREDHDAAVAEDDTCGIPTAARHILLIRE